MENNESEVLEPLILPPADPNAAMMELLRSMQTQMTDLKQSQDKLSRENAALQEELQNAKNAEPLSHNVSGVDFIPRSSAARSVVIATRPVQDEPNLYRQNGKGIVDTGALSKNDSSPLSGRNR